MLIASSGLALGHGRSSAIGLAVFLAAWAVGAFVAGRRGSSTVRDLLYAGVLVALLAWPAMRITLVHGPVATVLAIAAIGLVQGAFLPLLARAREGGVGPLFAANLAGSVAGAYAIGDLAVGAWGRSSAAVLAGGIGALAGMIGAAAARETRPAPPAAARWTAAALTVALCTGWLAGLEWISLRLGVLWLG